MTTAGSGGAAIGDIDLVLFDWVINTASFSLTSIERVTAPEPASMTILCAGIGVLLMPKGRLRSMRKQMNSTQL